MAVAVLIGGCAGDIAPFRSEFTGSGVPVALNTGGGTWSQSEDWTAQVGLAIGAVEGAGADVFGNVAALDVSADGRIYVIDGLAEEVRIFDPDGAHVRSFGGKGAGPGEFGNAAGLVIMPDAELWVFDSSQRRISVFSLDGDPVRTFARNISGNAYPWQPSLHGGRIIEMAAGYPERVGSEPGGLVVLTPFAVALDGTISDSFPRIEHHWPTVGNGFAVPGHGTPIHTIDASGEIWFAHSPEYAVYRRTLVGDTTLIVQLLDVDLEPVPDDEIAEELEHLAEHADLRTVDENLMARTRPVIARLALDGAGHLLVFPRLAGHPAGSVVDVFTTHNGEYLGRIGLPVTLVMSIAPIASESAIYGVTEDTLDVATVVRIDLTRSPRD